MAHTTFSNPDLSFLAAEGEMAERIRAHDWASTPLGRPEDWTPSLKAMVRMALTTRHPIFIFWGRDQICLYNDAYSASLGPEKHPSLLGTCGRDGWPEIWPIIGPQIELVLRGDGSTWHENQLVPILRHGAIQDVYWTYSYGPIDDASAPNGIGGVLVVCTETTEQILSERRMAAERENFAQLFEQSPSFMALLRGPQHVFEMANPSYMRLVGHRKVLGLGVAEALPESVEQGYIAWLDEVYRSGKAFTAFGSKFVMYEADGSTTLERYVDLVYQPIVDAEGRVTGIFVEGVDVSDRLAADDELRRLAARLQQEDRRKTEFLATL
ncbi:MAG: PAS domain-containing protein, partial [Burkholderiaceae bacterium]